MTAIIGAALALLLSAASCLAQPALNVGVEDIDYLPFHDFSDHVPQGFVPELLARFAAEQGRTLRYHPLPIKRLARAREAARDLDLYYPDNPQWHDPAVAARRAYSAPLVRIIGATMVPPARASISREAFRVLSLPRGFTPIEWRELIGSGQVRTLEAPDARAALRLVLIGRADGADVEYHVARHLLGLMGRPDALVIAPQLPLSSTGLHVSSADPVLIAALDAFLTRHADEIAALRRAHGIVASTEGALRESRGLPP